MLVDACTWSCLLPPERVRHGVSLPRKIRSNESEKIHTATGSLVACMGSQLVNHRYGMGPPTEAAEPTGRDCPNEATH